jgi:hypothetical protein
MGKFEVSNSYGIKPLIELNVVFHGEASVFGNKNSELTDGP